MKSAISTFAATDIPIVDIGEPRWVLGSFG